MRLLGCVIAALLLAGCGTDAVEEPPAAAETTYEFSATAIDRDGVTGVLYVPRDARDSPGVVVLGGTEGGTPWPVAEQFAAAGHTTLALAYFGEPGLPTEREPVPLEYVANALRWMPDQPAVRDRPPVLWGGSRGAEGALQVASRWPDLVGGVVAASVADTSVCRSFDGELVHEWTYRGRLVPCVRFLGGYAGYEEAAIRVEDLTSPLLMVCGEDDTLGPACPMGRRVLERLDEAGSGIERALLAYEGAGHSVIVPPDVEALPEQQIDPEVNLEARTLAWEETLAFVRGLPSP